MSPVVADYVIMVVFGILLGVILKLFGSISGSDRTTGPAVEHPRRSLRERVAAAFDRDRLRAENESRLKSMPRSAWLAMVFFYGIVAMLIVVVKVSPITMRWWPFLGSVLGAFMITGFVFTRTAAASRRMVDSSV
ncbi:MAG: hypothetical protein Q7S40_34760 [Opitutaceae bacterium]|nr:hypothetical protein [Opitutaceae bacterium]